MTILAYAGGAVAASMFMWLASAERGTSAASDAILMDVGGVLGAWALVRRAYPSGWQKATACTIFAVHGASIVQVTIRPGGDSLSVLASSLLAVALAALTIWPLEWQPRPSAWF